MNPFMARTSFFKRRYFTDVRWSEPLAAAPVDQSFLSVVPDLLVSGFIPSISGRTDRKYPCRKPGPVLWFGKCHHDKSTAIRNLIKIGEEFYLVFIPGEDIRLERILIRLVTNPGSVSVVS